VRNQVDALIEINAGEERCCLFKFRNRCWFSICGLVSEIGAFIIFVSKMLVALYSEICVLYKNINAGGSLGN